MSPGQYLHKCRRAANLDLIDTAVQLAKLPEARKPVTLVELSRLGLRIRDAEHDLHPLPIAQAQIVARVLPFSVGTYVQLMADRRPDRASRA
jgi:hypothetical protein